MKEYRDRLLRRQMTYYKVMYRDSPRWTGDSLAGKHLLIYMEQGLGDCIQFARYIPLLSSPHITLQCQQDLHRLFSQFSVDCIDKEAPVLPLHDCHALSFSLPFLLGSREAPGPYLKAQATDDLGSGMKIGIAWEGNPVHSNNPERCCPLRHFRKLQRPGVTLVVLQQEVHNEELYAGCDDMELYGRPLEDLQDTAGLIQSVDLVVTVDTSILHLAGALGKRVYGLLPAICDSRWNIDTWYPSLTLLRQDNPGEWGNVFDRLMSDLLRENN